MTIVTFFGIALLIVSFLARRSMKSIARAGEMDMLLSEALNAPANGSTGLYYSSSVTSKGMNIYAFFISLVWFVSMIAGCLLIGGSLV